MPRHSVEEGLLAPSDYELSNLRKESSENSQRETYRDDNSDDDADRNELKALDEDDPLHERTTRLSDDTELETFQLYTPDEERQVLRKMDWHVTTFMSFLYLLSFLDRSNIGNAKIAGLTRDLRLKGDQFEWLLTAFYVTYIAFEWMIMLYHVLTPRIYISLCVLSWGLVASLQAIVTSFPQLLILRAFLGIGEAAFSPGVPFYLSFFYRREELAFRAAIQVSAAPLAASFAGSLAWIITRLGRHSPIAPWRLLFLAEGFPSVVIAAVAWYVVANDAGSAWFLTERQRRIARLRLEEVGTAGRKGLTSPQHGRLQQTKQRRLVWVEVWNTVKDPKCYLTALMFLSSNIAFSSMPVFLPTVINEMGFSTLTSQALSAPPFLLSFIFVLLVAKSSDYFRTRSPFVIISSLLAASGYTLAATCGILHWPSWLRYLSVYPACMGFFAAITIIITWTMNNQQSHVGRGVGMTILNVVGQCGPLIGTRLYPEKDRPWFVRGMVGCAIAMGAVFVLALILRAVLVAENRRREKEDRTRDTDARAREIGFRLML